MKRDVRFEVFERMECNPHLTLEEALSPYTDKRERGWAEASWWYHTIATENGGLDPDEPINYKGFDPEVRELCELINTKLPGIKTTGSCCGHGRGPVLIFLKVDEGDHRGLFVLARSVSRRYWEYGHRWSLTVEVGDEPEKPLPITYVLESKSRGEKAYGEIDSMVESLRFHLGFKAFLEGYSLKL